MTKAAIYIRLTEFGPPAEEQRAECALEIEARKWTFVQEFVDRDSFTGKPSKAYEEFQAAIRRGHMNVVVAHSAERLFRNLSDVDTLLRVARAGNVSFVLCREKLTTAGTHGAFLQQAASLIVNIMQKRRSEISAVAMQRRRRQGFPVGRPPKITPELDRQIDELLRTNMSQGGVARELGVARWRVRRRQHALKQEDACLPST